MNVQASLDVEFRSGGGTGPAGVSWSKGAKAHLPTGVAQCPEV